MIKNVKVQSLVKIHTAVFLFGMAALFARWIDLPSEVIVFGRVFFGGLSFAVLFYFSKENIRVKNKPDLFVFFLNGCLLAFHWFAFFYAIKLSTIAVGLLSYSTFPVFIVFMEPLFFKGKLRLSFVFLALLSIAGVYLIIPSFSLDNNITLGVLWGVLSAFSFALISLINRLMLESYNSRVLSFYLNVFAAFALIPFLFFASFEISLGDFSLLLLLGVLFTAVAHNLFIGGMRHIAARIAALIAALEPVYGIIFALVLLSEVPEMKTIIGGLLIVFAMIIGSKLK